mmetsp:Transcript_90754/g.256262  ORF Transcript_90754/g.256262 Transcript_90754/m.256262 type:complete len:402 (-) Transcript_90754:210-1415(-)
MDQDGGGFDAAPPPVSGLGNFKGVMLCNRPVDNPTSQLNGGDGPQPFKSMVSSAHGEQLGLTPCKNFEPTVKKRGPSAALRRHVKWLKELETQMKEEREQVEEEEMQEEERERRRKAVLDSHRQGVREMMQARQEAWDMEEKATKTLKRLAREAKKAASTKGERVTPPKPLWAMTEKEKDDFEEADAADLINFAENLDYEKYVHDLEFRQGVDAVKDRAGKLQKEQDAFKEALVKNFNALVEAEDEERSTSAGGSPRSSKQLEEGVDGQSIFGDLRSEYSVGSRRPRAEDRHDGRNQWDSSTNCGDERHEVDRQIKDAAEAVLESNTNMRMVHSKGSVLKLIEKARERHAAEAPPGDLCEMMLREGPAPIPVITASADTQNRLHKPTDPSLLPYLYRSPAI